MQLLPYRGLGSGIPRALGAWPTVEFDDDVRGNQFRVVVARPPMPVITGTSNGTQSTTGEAARQVTPQVTPQVAALINVGDGELSRAALMERLGLQDRMYFARS